MLQGSFWVTVAKGPGRVLWHIWAIDFGTTAVPGASQMLHRILSERAAMTPEMAVRVGKLCGNGPRIWLAMQQAHDLWQVERNLSRQVAAIPMMRAA